MAVTQNSYTGNGSTTQYSFTFPYLKSSEVKAQIDATVTTAFTLANATTVQFNTAPANGAKIKIYRETDDAALAATFYAGSAIKSEDLNDNFTQNLYTTQEVNARYLSNLGGTMVGDLTMGEDADMVFEGATDDAYETTLTVADPTADRTITLPNVTGTVVTTGDTATVTATMLADDSVNTAELVNSAVTTGKINTSAVTTAKIANDAVTGIKIADDQINSEHYVDGSIDTAHIADSQITTAKLATDAITQAKIADDAIGADQLASNSVVSASIVDGTIVTADIADNAITNAKMADDSVGAAELIDTSVGTAALASNAVTLAKMADSSVGTAEIVNDAVTTVKIANNAVTTAKITDSNVTTAKINNDAVTQDKIADDAVGTAQLIDASVNADRIASDAVTTAKIQDDAVTSAKIAANAVTTTEIADAELTTLAGMQSGTASILAAGTTLTATLAEINTVVDGKSVQTTISDTDASYPTSGAVVDYVAAQIAPLGGLEVIANEDSFPSTIPSSGVVISIADAGGVVVNGSGVSTTARTAGNGSDNVTINGFPSSLYSTTLTDNMGLMVSSTGSSNTYTYHKLLGKEDDIKQLSDDINDFAARYRVASSAPSSSLDNGDLWYDTANAKMMVYSATNSAWEEVTSTGDFYINTISSYSGTGGNNATFNGTAYRFVLSNPPSSAQQLIVSVNGVIQKPNSGTGQPSEGFALNGSSIVFSAAPATGADYFIITVGSTVAIGTPSDNTVATAKIQNLAVTGDKIATNLDLADNKKIRFGTGNDLEIFHDGSNSYIDDTGTGSLITKSNHYIVNSGAYSFMNAANTETIIYGAENAAVNLYYDNSTKLETKSYGLSLHGDVLMTNTDNQILKFGAGNDLQIYHDGTRSWVRDANAGNLIIDTNGSEIDINSGGNAEYMGRFIKDGAVEAYYDNSKKFETTSAGVDVTGVLQCDEFKLLDGEHAKFGTGEDLRIYHDGSHSYISDTGTGYLLIKSSEVQIQSSTGEDMAKFIPDGAVELYHNNVKKLDTVSGGINVVGYVNLQSGGHVYLEDNGKLMIGTSTDLQIYHTGSDSWIKNTTGVLVFSGPDIQLANVAGNEQYIRAVENGGVKLYYDNSQKLTTSSTGIEVSGNVHVNDSDNLQCGNSADLKIYHSGSHSHVSQNGTGNLYLDAIGASVNLRSGDNAGGVHNSVVCNMNAGVELYYDNSKKFETTSDGISVLGVEGGNAAISIYADEGDDNADKWQIVAKADASQLRFQGLASGGWLTGGYIYYNDYIQNVYRGPVGGIRFDENINSPSSDAWSALNGDGHFHRTDGQAYATTDDYFRFRKNGNSENKRFEFRTDTGNAGAQNDWQDDQFDFAEMFEWSDGNPDNQDRIGNTVAVDGLTGKIKIAETGDTVIGVVSGTAAFTANCASMQWQGAYLRDEWGRLELELVKDENGNQLYNDPDNGNVRPKVNLKPNPDWDENQSYHRREDRKEWDKIGIIGQCYVRKTAVKPSSWIKLKEVDSTKDFYLIK